MDIALLVANVVIVGTFVRNGAGAIFVDFVGDASPNPAQISVFRAYA